MAEQKKGVKTFIVRYFCDNCNTEVEPTGKVLSSNPPKYPHKCPGCEATYTFGHRYPYQKFKEQEKK